MTAPKRNPVYADAASLPPFHPPIPCVFVGLNGEEQTYLLSAMKSSALPFGVTFPLPLQVQACVAHS